MDNKVSYLQNQLTDVKTLIEEGNFTRAEQMLRGSLWQLNQLKCTKKEHQGQKGTQSIQSTPKTSEPDKKKSRKRLFIPSAEKDWESIPIKRVVPSIRTPSPSSSVSPASSSPSSSNSQATIGWDTSPSTWPNVSDIIVISDDEN